MKVSAKSLSAILILFALFPTPHAADEGFSTDENLKWLGNSIDIENKEFVPGEPKNEFQKVMGEFMKSMIEQNTKTQKSIALIGPIEFESTSDLANAEHILIFRENITQFKKVKKSHYDTLDILFKDANTKIGKTDLAKKRLGGSAAFYEEKLELFFLFDLDNYYKFILQNHDKFLFQEEETIVADDNVLKQYNVLREKMVSSANNINKTQALKNNLLKDRIDELQDWASEN